MGDNSNINADIATECKALTVYLVGREAKVQIDNSVKLAK